MNAFLYIEISSDVIRSSVCFNSHDPFVQNRKRRRGEGTQNGGRGGDIIGLSHSRVDPKPRGLTTLACVTRDRQYPRVICPSNFTNVTNRRLAFIEPIPLYRMLTQSPNLFSMLNLDLDSIIFLVSVVNPYYSLK